ncbi:Calx-beta domain-containing protein [Arenimonas sp. MALMAid1274]|uniref:Calx-beta domain-containing protein n=1 Tax=Arenimonas sp. MALMAid1274 TaxID=3411630 RepID=UPI003B9F7CE4
MGMSGVRAFCAVFSLLLAVPTAPSAQTISTFAGGGAGDGGQATQAYVRRAAGGAFDAAGNFYFAERGGHRVRKVGTNGVITTVAGTGVSGFSGDGGPATSARLSQPMDVAVDAAGNLYIADLGNLRLRKVLTNGTITTLAGDGSSVFRDNVPGLTGGFSYLSALALDAAGNVYIADGADHQRIRKVAPDGFLTTVAGNGVAGYTGDGGPATSASIAAASDVAFDAAGNLYIADPFHAVVRRVDTGGQISTVAGGGMTDADGIPPLQAQLRAPSSVGIGPDGALYIGEENANRVRRVASGLITTVAGNGGTDTTGDGGPAIEAGLGYVESVTLAPDGRIAIVANGFTVRIATVGGSIQRFAGGGVGDGGAASQAYLGETGRVAVDGEGNVLVSTYGRIRRITPAGIISTVAGFGQEGFTGDGGPASAAQIGSVGGLVGGVPGEVFFVDSPAWRIRRVGPDGVISTFAQIPWLTGLARDPAGNLYTVAGNQILRITPAGVQSVFAGTVAAGFSGDGGQAAAASFRNPCSLLHSQGSLYVGDCGNYRLRRIAADGVVSTVAGNGMVPYTGPGTATQIPVGQVLGMDDDAEGNLYLAIANERRVHKLTVGGQWQQIAGDGDYGFFGDGGPAAGARFTHVNDVAYSAQGSGSVFVSDEDNERIRVVSLGAVAAVPGTPDAPVAVAGDGKAVISFDPPANPGSSPITGYLLTSTPAGAIDAEAGTLTRRRIVTGLQNGTSYRFSVRAINAVGPGLPSALSAAVVPGTAQTLPILSLSPASGEEGSEAVFVVRLDRAASAPVGFSLRTENGTATSGADFVGRTASLSISAGNTSAAFPVSLMADGVSETDETFRVVLHGVSNATLGIDQAVGTIRNNDNPLPPPLAARDDRYELPVNAAETLLDVLDNDVFTAARLAGGSVTITEPALHGSASAWTSGTSGSAADDFIRYAPAEGFSGEDVFAYRVCESGGRCVEAMATIVLRPSPRSVVTSAVVSGNSSSVLQGLPALPSLEFQATPLAVPNVTQHAPAPDATPTSPWDNGRSGSSHAVYTIAAPTDGLPRKFRILVEASAAQAADVDLYVGVDSNGDGLPALDELRCTSLKAGTAAETCDFGLQHPGTGTLAYWVMLHNIDFDTRAVNTHAFAVPLVATDGTLVATGPGSLAPAATGRLTWGWDEPGALDGLRRRGFVRVLSGGVEYGQFPVGFDRVGRQSAGKALQSGIAHRLRLSSGEAQERLFIDVPEGASSLTVSASGFDVDVYLARGAQDAGPGIALAPARNAASASLMAVQGTREVSLAGSQLTPGRWYVTPVNTSPTGAAIVTLTASVTGVAPVIRPGSYFNAARGGHGLFLYPAGGSWAGLWYTYLKDGTPTWYYLQGLKPGLNGLWNATLYRSAWNGSSNKLTVIGRAVVSPTGPDAFRFSFSVDGETGSEPMTALGRGCPTVGGLSVDASSHWFDPARGGTGYSVQLFPNYEFYAAFVYDGQGIARYLLAERPTIGGPAAALTLQQLTGFCPTCERLSAPTRVNVGTLSRTISGGSLVTLGVNGTYTGIVPGSWSAQDTVQPLGGTGTTQGCQP